jgi:hypothetical protein
MKKKYLDRFYIWDKIMLWCFNLNIVISIVWCLALLYSSIYPTNLWTLASLTLMIIFNMMVYFYSSYRRGVVIKKYEESVIIPKTR